MPTRDLWNQDSLVWHFGLFDGGPAIGSDHDVEAPQVWVRALEAVARDLRCLRYGRDVRLGGLVWDLAVNGDYAVTIGWQGVHGISGFSRCDGLSMDTPFTEAAVWVADTVQSDLAGYDFVQWPSQGQRMLQPRKRDDGPVWIDTHTDATVAAIGELCQYIER